METCFVYFLFIEYFAIVPFVLHNYSIFRALDFRPWLFFFDPYNREEVSVKG